MIRYILGIGEYMEEKCLYEVRSVEYSMKNIQTIIIFLYIFMAFLFFSAFSSEIALGIVFLGILIYLFFIKKKIIKPLYTKVKFYSDKFCLVGEEKLYISYNDIEGIIGTPSATYIITKKNKQVLTNNDEKIIEYNKMIIVSNPFFGIAYNKIKKLTNANDLCSLVRDKSNILPEKKSEVKLKIEKKSSMLIEYVALMIATAAIVALLYGVYFAINMFIPLNINVELFLSISFLVTLIICWKNFNFNEQTTHIYDFYSNCFIESYKKDAYEKGFYYDLVTKISVKKKDENKYNVCLENLHETINRNPYSYGSSSYKKHILLSDVAFDEVEQIKDLIEKSKNI